MIALSTLLLVFAPLAGAAAVWRIRQTRAVHGLALLSAAVSAGAAVAVAVEVHRDGPREALGGWIYIDALSVIILVLTAVVGLVVVVNSLAYISHEITAGALTERDRRHYYSLLLTFLATMLAVPVLNNLGTMWIAVEATTIVSAVLVGLYRTGTSSEAAWKYLVLASVGIALALFGTIMTFYAAASLTGEGEQALQWTALARVAAQLDPDVMRLAFVLVLVGYGTKVGLAPMHTWLPDAHSQAPTPVSALLSGVLLNAAVYALLRFRVLTTTATGEEFADHLLIAFGLLSVVIAVPFILVQHDVKRLLAYHSVEHMGIIVLALGINSRVALYAGLLHLIAHSLTKSSLFLAAGSIVQWCKTRSMHRMRGLLRVTPLAGVGFLAGVIALAGLPPFAMFTSEYGLVAGAFGQHRAIIGVVAAVFIALAAASLLTHAVAISFGEPRRSMSTQRLSFGTAVSALAPLAVLLWISVAPPTAFVSMLNQAVEVLEGR